MLSLRAATDIRAPADVVFAVLSTPERLPEWNTSVESARRGTPDEVVCLGSRAIFAGRLLGQILESETQVVEFEPPRLFATRAIRGPRLNSRFELEPLPEGTRVRLDVSGEVPGGRLGGMLAEGFLRRELSASLDRLRAVCEESQRVS
ncbi:MAG TPA: SRPBCC family protein [Chloroflexota bacterium]